VPEKVSTTAISKKVGGLLLAANVVKPEQYEAAMKEIEGTPDRIEDAIIALGFASEADILKTLAAHYQTNFVSSERLSRAEIARATLELVPRQVAETFGVFPVMFDVKNHVLSVVTADPGDASLLNEIRQVSGAKDVKAFLSRPAAVRAAIAKSYAGDIHAFAMLDRAAQVQFHAMLDVYTRGTMSEASVAAALVREEGQSRSVTERDVTRGDGKTAKGGGVSSESLLELCNVMVSLLENNRAELRGHSSLVARIVRRVVERINLPPAAVSACVAAAYLHDVGKMGTFHLTALNASEYDGHKAASQKAHNTPTRLLEGVSLPSDTILAVLHMYERYDGKGFPDSLSGKDIPLGARVLAIADTYADLTENPRNPYRKQLSAKEACEVLVKYKNAIFDPHLIDLFRAAVLGDDVRARLIGDRYTALLVDPDPEETTVLELRMFEQGFDVKVARSAEQALKVLSTTDVDMVVSELDFPQGGDGLKLLADARKLPKGKDVPWVIHARRQAKADATTAFSLGVLDYVTKPAPTDVFVAKLKAIIEQRAMQRTARGVSGSLREMALPDIIQILYHGRKTGKLRIRSGSEQGEIHVDGGAVVNALLGAVRGEDAFYAMLKLTDGEFALDPQFKPQQRVINQSSEALLLEGMRRMDEGVG
jgi:response regulator RpfG family c-di-GMP phosphodiesterase